MMPTPSTLVVACPLCSHRYRLPTAPAKESAKLKCRTCGTVFHLSEGLDPPAPVSDEEIVRWLIDHDTDDDEL